jgi:Lecithin retinol acyltransferase
MCRRNAGALTENDVPVGLPHDFNGGQQPYIRNQPAPRDSALRFGCSAEGGSQRHARSPCVKRQNEASAVANRCIAVATKTRELGNRHETSFPEAVHQVRRAATMPDIRATLPHSRQSFLKRVVSPASRERSWCAQIASGDRPLVEGEEPPLGFEHHGIYVGEGSVVHYGTLARGLRRRPVEEVSLAQFAHGHPVWRRGSERDNFDREEVIRRARSRLGEDHYRLFTNNCEHFCEWCLHDRHRSYQVEQLLARPDRMLRAIRTRAVTLLAVRSFRTAWS